MSNDIIPVVVVASPDGEVSRYRLEKAVAEFETKDDVFSSDFLGDTIVVVSEAKETPETPDIAVWTVDSMVLLPDTLASDTKSIPGTADSPPLRKDEYLISRVPSSGWGGKRIFSTSITANVLPPGPYFLAGDALHQAWRMYPDELDVFATTFVAQNLHSVSEPM